MSSRCLAVGESSQCAPGPSSAQRDNVSRLLTRRSWAALGAPISIRADCRQVCHGFADDELFGYPTAVECGAHWGALPRCRKTKPGVMSLRRPISRRPACGSLFWYCIACDLLCSHNKSMLAFAVPMVAEGCRVFCTVQIPEESASR